MLLASFMRVGALVVIHGPGRRGFHLRLGERVSDTGARRWCASLPLFHLLVTFPLRFV